MCRFTSELASILLPYLSIFAPVQKRVNKTGLRMLSFAYKISPWLECGSLDLWTVSTIPRTDRNFSLCLNSLYKQGRSSWTPVFLLELGS